jgi:hypothetical protein
VVTDYLLRRTHNLQIARSLQAGQAYDQIVHEYRAGTRPATARAQLVAISQLGDHRAKKHRRVGER